MPSENADLRKECLRGCPSIHRRNHASHSVTPLSAFLEPVKARKKLLKKEKRAKWLAKNRDVINEKKRQARKRAKR